MVNRTLLHLLMKKTLVGLCGSRKQPSKAKRTGDYVTSTKEEFGFKQHTWGQRVVGSNLTLVSLAAGSWESY